ncbi:DUF397 domain-containing protein [Streptomyces flavofungini]|uniref:DUF397 domain-containing protein n=1 Tax=Streptomyces flavofungini TaxID=68200 RepID=A0ABS0X6S3_9ACTN|nr:DUF397 domain-containing protein [Streptomyces flavofungini]MBJ3808905.1 DUF397 domain-containing protein [Streptomyces flavofungini]GHC48455.1 hypothetical protein GCM10010349_12250 [Streptomyces flavofungini]
MFQLTWQKSSYSTGGEGECVELATDPTGRIHLRESDRPAEMATTTPAALRGLLHHIKASARGQA